MGFAKEKLFGKRPHKWPKLQSLVEKGELLNIDIAYAETQVPHGSEEEALSHATKLAMVRQGHLTLPKHVHYEEQIVSHVKRLLPQLSIITGGPGTGKTYTAAQIVRERNTKTLLAAPTGKAAAHLESQFDLPMQAKTLHSLLKVHSPLDYQTPIDPLEANLVIVDECSMIDPPLFARLLSAIGPETTLILLGDPNQLPAVEGGSVFADLIASGAITTTTLTKCMRSDRREILDLAAAILRGDPFDMRNIDLGFASGDLETIYQKLWNHVKTRDFDHFRILCTLRKGPLGVDALNRFLHEKFSAQTCRFPILITRNDARSGLYNGDMGVLENQEAHFSGDRHFALHELPPFEYAYCISVHKSQGSEYDHVLFLVPDGSEAFGREVLYTAVTRAKNTLEIEGNPSQIAAALERSSLNP